jgi:hypothetical protein
MIHHGRTKSALSTWRVIELFATSAPTEAAAAIADEYHQDTRRCGGSSIDRIYDGDALIYHGEDGFCLGEQTLDVAGGWLEELREAHGLHRTDVFYVRIKEAL